MNAQTNETATPRTDAVAQTCLGYELNEPDPEHVPADFSRQLEHSLSTVTAQLAEAKDTIEGMKGEIAATMETVCRINAQQMGENDTLRIQLSSALALADENGRKCAEMRETVQLCSDYIYSSDAQHYAGEAPHMDKVGSTIDSALSSDAGKDFVHKSELEKVQREMERKHVDELAEIIVLRDQSDEKLYEMEETLATLRTKADKLVEALKDIENTVSNSDTAYTIAVDALATWEATDTK